MKRRKAKARLMAKQIWKYAIIIIVAVLGMGIYRLIWSIPDKPFYYSVSIVAAILIILAVFDVISHKDIIAVFKG